MSQSQSPQDAGQARRLDPDDAAEIQEVLGLVEDTLVRAALRCWAAPEGIRPTILAAADTIAAALTQYAEALDRLALAVREANP